MIRWLPRFAREGLDPVQTLVERAIVFLAKETAATHTYPTRYPPPSHDAVAVIPARAPPRLNRLVLSIEADLVRLRRGAARRRR